MQKHRQSRHGSWVVLPVSALLYAALNVSVWCVKTQNLIMYRIGVWHAGDHWFEFWLSHIKDMSSIPSASVLHGLSVSGILAKPIWPVYYIYGVLITILSMSL